MADYFFWKKVLRYLLSCCKLPDYLIVIVCSRTMFVQIDKLSNLWRCEMQKETVAKAAVVETRKKEWHNPELEEICLLDTEGKQDYSTKEGTG